MHSNIEKVLCLLYNSIGDSMEKHVQIGFDILKTFHDAQYEAFFVGGFVRDTLLKRQTHDIDITTNATPNDIQRLFNKVIATGKAFGTMTIIEEGLPYEVTTYRQETTYTNNRHPDQIRFADTLIDDLSRRDFTINQLVMDLNGDIHDHFNGKHDLNLRLIKTIGDPNERFQEDALRILRALRFAATLNFKIHHGTKTAILTNDHLIRHLSIERVQEELFKLFDAPLKKTVIDFINTTDIPAILKLTQTFIALNTIDDSYDHIDAFTIMAIKNELNQAGFKLSKAFKAEVMTRASLFNHHQNQPFTPRSCFETPKETLLGVNHLLTLFGFDDQRQTILKMIDALPIRTLKELAYRGRHIKEDLNPKQKTDIKTIESHLLDGVLTGKYDNDASTLKKAAQDYLYTLESE